jgi:hypothetical protein
MVVAGFLGRGFFVRAFFFDKVFLLFSFRGDVLIVAIFSPLQRNST